MSDLAGYCQPLNACSISTHQIVAAQTQTASQHSSSSWCNFL